MPDGWTAALTELVPLFESRWARLVLLLVAATLVAKLVDWLVRRVLPRWSRRTRSEVDDELLRALHRPLFVSVVLLGGWLATVELGLPGHLQSLTLRILKTIGVVLWSLFAADAAGILLAAMARHQERLPLVQPRTLPLFDNLARLLVLGGAIYFLFLSWGIDVTAWLASAGIIGLAVGFAAKDTLANLFSGIFILADSPYKVGDFIVLDSGERGQVTQIGLRSTRLLTRDDVEITLPNAVIAAAKIVNESGGPWEKERLRVQLSVAYGSDIDQVREVLEKIAADNREVSTDPAPRVRFRSFGDSGLNLELLCWIDQPIFRGRVLDALNTSVYKAFNAASIEIPYPKRDVYLHRVDP